MEFKDTKSAVYVDMDGLLADLFSAVSQKLFHKPYKQITPEQKAEAKRIWYDRAHFVDNFGEVEEFFAELPPFGPNGELTNAIIDTIVDFADTYTICSHPAGIDKEACKRGKISWINTHLSPRPSKMLFPQSKAAYAKTGNVPNILVDDFPPYVEAWRNAGGIAIQMRTDDFHSVEQVKDFLTKELLAAKEQIEQRLVQEESFDTLYEKFLDVFES